MASRTKQEAIEMLVRIIEEKALKAVSLSEAEEILNMLTDQDEGLGMYPPLTKKGKYDWEELAE